MSIEIENVNSIIDAIEIDPRTRIKTAVARICNRELNTLAIELHANLLRQPLAELQRRVSLAFDNFKIDQIPDAIADFARELRAAVIREKATNPALKAWSAEDQIKQNASAFNALHWNGNETAEIQRMLKPGDKIARIGLRQIELASGRVINRGDLRAHAIARRPRGVVPDDETFLRQNFTSDLVLADIETSERVARKEASVYRAGPPNLIGKPLPAAQGE
ncbi:MAG TPA: hypothetical protein VMV27_07840 [Candidatus Binataceae bacterium]|nr:hypothetical protein [Candidatus Binataceae bacterium]